MLLVFYLFIYIYILIFTLSMMFLNVLASIEAQHALLIIYAEC